MNSRLNSRLLLSDIDNDILIKLKEKTTIKNPKVSGFLKLRKSRKQSPFYKDSSGDWVLNEKQMGWVLRALKCEEYLNYWRKEQDGYSFPYGIISELKLDKNEKKGDISLAIKDKLRWYQKEAISALYEYKCGILNLPTGSGKTFTAIGLISAIKEPTLVIVDRKELLYQWIDEASRNLGIPKESIGILGDGKKTIGDWLTIGIVNTIAKVVNDTDFDKLFDCVIVDECHTAPAKTFTDVLDVLNAEYKYGLSATPYRRESEENKIMLAYLGRIRYDLSPSILQNEGHILKPELKIIYTNFTDKKTIQYKAFDGTHQTEETIEYTDLIRQLYTDKNRNYLIIDTLKKLEGDLGGVILIMCDQVDPLSVFLDIAKDAKIKDIEKSAILTGKTKKKDREEIVKKLRAGEIRFLFSTSSLIGKGFDLPAMSAIFLTSPIRFSGKLIQAVGRILRAKTGKNNPVIVDFVDYNIGIFKNQFYGRKKAYQKIGI